MWTVLLCMLFFFKQKTAYEMRISDWSSDVCSSDLVDPALKRRLQHPMKVGAAIILVLVLGLGAWASFSGLETGINAQGSVRVESNRKTMRFKNGGTVRRIMVREGQRVRPGPPLIQFDGGHSTAAPHHHPSQYQTPNN